jgi:hypothetical protein
MTANAKQAPHFWKLPQTALLSFVVLLLPAQNSATAQSTPLKPPTPLAAPKTGTPAVAINTPTANLNTSLVALKIVPNVALMAKIRALPPDAVVETSSGRKVTAAHFVATMDGLKGLSAKQAKLKPMAFNFSRPTAAAAVKINANTFASVRAMPHNTVLELPSGVKLTNGELKQLETLEARTNIRQLMGSSVSIAASVPNNAAAKYAGLPAIKLRTQADIAQLKGKPDSTIVEAPDGTRSTLGELKAALAAKFAAK